MRKSYFNLIELIVVIVVIGILASIVIPNTSNVNQDASVVALKNNIKNLQTGVDIFIVENDGVFPTKEDPRLGEPKTLELNALHPKYIKNLPKNDSIKYWLDDTAKVWFSYIDAPKQLIYEERMLSWPSVSGAKAYNIYQTNNAIAEGKSSAERYTLIKTIEHEKGEFQNVELPKLVKGTYLVSAIDTYEFETPPVKLGGFYTEYQEADEDFSADKKKSGEYIIENFYFTGDKQEWVVPRTGTYLLETWGAEGGYVPTTTREGGKGGYSRGEIYLEEGQILYIYVGGKGENGNSKTDIPGKGGFNGGGDGSENDYPLGVDRSSPYGSPGGGGATDIRLMKDSLYDRIIVAAGGGASGYHAVGGDGGGLIGGDGQHSRGSVSGALGPKGATQTQGGQPAGGTINGKGEYVLGQAGSFGKGGNANVAYHPGGGGGGGWYGGASGTSGYQAVGGSGGSGGSSYIEGLSNATTTSGVQSGNGMAKVTFVE